jgi:hypothetical protein
MYRNYTILKLLIAFFTGLFFVYPLINGTIKNAYFSTLLELANQYNPVRIIKDLIFGNLSTGDADIGGETQYDAIASRLWNSMKVYGTDEEEVFNLLNGKSTEQLQHIYNAFGQKRYEKISGVDGAMGGKHDLVVILKNEFNGNNLRRIKNMFKHTGLW